MKKVMLVDDEILFRESLRDCFDWESEGFIYCGDASDGEMALPLIEQLQPDILITDISMPFMNGLELCSIVRTQLPDTKIIILSGHGEFEYARSAVRMGVEDYCLKPVSPGELIQLLHEVSRKIDKERESKASINQRITLTKEKLFNDLCSGFVTASEAIHWATDLQVNLIARFYAVVMIDNRSQGIKDSRMTEELNMNEVTLLQRYERLYNNGSFMFPRSRTENVWIMKGDTLDQLYEAVAAFKELQLLIHNTMSASSIGLSVGIGSVQDRLHNVHLSFLDAAEDMYWRRLSSQNRLALTETSDGALDPSVFLDRSQFIDFLKIGDQTRLVSFIETLCAPLQGLHWKTSPIGRYILNDVTLEAFRSAKDMYSHINPEETLQRYQQQIGKVQCWEEACSYLTALAEQFWSWRSTIYDKYGPLLNKVKDYMLANFGNDTLSLQNAAEYVNVSPSHLSKIFSQETGQTFIEYLTQIRIRKAMDLLMSTPAKSYEIAYQVGYNDPHYFSSLFKRVTGKTTTEFRKSGLADIPKAE